MLSYMAQTFLPYMEAFLPPPTIEVEQCYAKILEVLILVIFGVMVPRALNSTECGNLLVIGAAILFIFAYCQISQKMGFNNSRYQ